MPLLKEKISINYIVSLFIAMSGIILISQPHFIFGNDPKNEKKIDSAEGYYLAIAAAVITGLSFVCMRKGQFVIVCCLPAFPFFFSFVL